MGLHIGTISVYGGGGYHLDLPQDKELAVEMIDELFANLWVDRGTSALFIHTNIYNTNTNLFCIVS